MPLALAGTAAGVAIILALLFGGIVGERSASAQSATEFTPQVNITVPQTDANGDGVNDYAGVEFVVQFRRIFGHEQRCRAVSGSSISNIYVVADNGLVGLKQDLSASVLVNTPVSASRTCEYSVSFKKVVTATGGVYLGLESGAIETVSAGSSLASASYSVLSVFTPKVAITVPPADSDGNSVNDFSGTTFRVWFISTEESDSRCVTSRGSLSAATVYFEVNDRGLVGLRQNQLDFVLVDTPVGSSGACEYSVEFPNAVSFPDGLLGLESGATGSVSAMSNLASASYSVVHAFSPEVRISVPQTDADGDGVNDFAGASFRVSFMSTPESDTRCASAGDSRIRPSADYVVHDNGSVVLGRIDFSTRPHLVVPGVGSTPVLTHTPTGASRACAYNVSLPEFASFEISGNSKNRYWKSDSQYLKLQSGASERVSPGSALALASYDLFSGFEPQLQGVMTVPQTDANGDGTNDYAGTRIGFNILASNDCNSWTLDGTPGGGLNDHIVNNDGSVRQAINTHFVYEDIPVGAPENCAGRWALFQPIVPVPGGHLGLKVEANMVQKVSIASDSSSASYEIVATFEPEVGISVPQIDADNDGVNDFSGTEFLVSFSRTLESDARCTHGGFRYSHAGMAEIFYSGRAFGLDSGDFIDGTSRSYVVADNGLVNLKQGQSEPKLVDTPVGESTKCDYTVSFSELRVSDKLLGLDSSSVESVNSMTRLVSASYVVVPTFEPNVSISVPQTDTDGDGANDYFGTELRVNFSLAYKPDSICGIVTGGRIIREGSPTYTFVVSDRGSVDLKQDQSLPGLINMPVGTSNLCEYEVGFSFLAAVEGGVFLGREIGATSRVSAMSHSASASYGVVATFEPSVSISVPQIDADGDGTNDFSGTEFFGWFYGTTESDFRCAWVSSSHFSYIVSDRGLVGLRQDSSLPVLVDTPAGASERCEYNVSFPERVDIAEGLVLSIESGATETVNAGSSQATASYAAVTTFEPNVMISVPQTDAGGDGVNDFSGTEFLVKYRPVATSDTRCTGGNLPSGNSRTLVLVVADNGSVGFSQRFKEPVLVDRYSDSSSYCEYSLVFPSLVRKAGGQYLELESGASESVSEASPASASYAAVPSFIPSVMISVPQTDADGNGVNDFSGTRFTVKFMRTSVSDDDCNMSESANYVVSDRGAVGLAENTPEPVLADMPSGAPSRCEYSVSFTDLVSVAGGRFLSIESGATSSVSAMSSSASASYIVKTAFGPFKPSVMITVPQTDADGDGVNDFSGTEFSVGYGYRGGSLSSGCTSRIFNSEFVVDDGGTVGLRWDSSVPTLEDVPAGTSSRCEYYVFFPNPVALSGGRYLGVDVGNLWVSASSKLASVNYVIVPVFQPSVMIRVPPTDAIGDGANEFSGTQINVYFSTTGESHSGCTHKHKTVSAKYVVSDRGFVSLAEDSSEPVLVDSPPGASTPCEYRVSYSDRIQLSLTKHLVLESGATGLVSATSPSVSAGYIVAIDTNSESITLDPPSVPAVVGTYTVTVNGVGWQGAPDGLGVTVCSDAEGGDIANVNPVNALVACPTLVADTGRGNPNGGDTFSYDLSVSVSEDDITNGQIAIFVFELAAGSSWLTGANLLLNSPADSGGDQSGGGADAGGGNAGGGQSGGGSAGGGTGNAGAGAGNAGSGSGSGQAGAGGGQSGGQSGGGNGNAGAGSGGGNAGGGGAGTGAGTGGGQSGGGNGNAGVGSGGGNAGGGGAGGGNIGAGGGQSGGQSGGGNGNAGAGSAAATGPERQSVSVTLRVPARTGAGYGSTDAFRVRVFAPGACGSDTSLFGGVSARLGVTYFVRAVVGDQVVIGTGATQTSPGATYTIPEYEQIGSQQVDCVLRIAEVSSPDGCALRTTTQDSTGTSYVEISEADNFATTLEYDCAAQTAEREMSRGWTILRFNGQDGTTPAAFASALSDSVNSIWVWDPQTQGWSGWSASGRVATLASLSQGDLVMAYVPRTRTIAFSPSNLLDPPAASGSLTLPPLYSVQMFGGQTTAKLSELLTASVGVVPVIFRWNSQDQEWNYHLPGYGPVPSVAVPWFDEISPGDTVFIFNATGQDTTIAWS